MSSAPGTPLQKRYNTMAVYRRAVAKGALNGNALELVDLHSAFGISDPPSDTILGAIIPGIEYGPLQLHRWAFLKSPYLFLTYLAEQYSAPAPPITPTAGHADLDRVAVMAWLELYIFEQVSVREALVRMAGGDE